MRLLMLPGTRFLALFVIVAVVLGGCGGSDDDDHPESTATEQAGVDATATDPLQATEPEQAAATATESGEAEEQVTLRLGVSMTPTELEEFEAGLDQIREQHPNWDIQLEQTPQDGIVEKINTQIASDELPDVVQVQGLFAQPWIQQGVFASLAEYVSEDEFDVDDFWGASLDQFRYDGELYAIPNIVAPDLVYLNLDMFEAAGIEPPSDDWTVDDLAELAKELTLDSEGRNANDPNFDKDRVVQWGLSVSPNNIWGRHFLLPFGADPCGNEDCTDLQFSSPEVQEALQFWADLVASGAAPHDPYTGNQTGVPGEGFQAGIAAMGINGFFLIGVLNDTEEIDYNIVEFPTGPAGVKASPLSTNGWVIAETSDNKDAAWQLIEELTSPDFLTEVWAQPGHGIPSRQSASEAILNPDSPPENQQDILDTLEYAEVFYPNTHGAFEVFGRTSDIFIAMMRGDTPIEEGTAEIDSIADEVFGVGTQ